MNKFLFSLLLLAIWSLMTYSQPSPPTSTTSDVDKEAPPEPQDMVQDNVVVTIETEAGTVEETGWYCDIYFYYNGKPYYHEEFDPDNLSAYRGSFARRVDNKISQVTWSGTGCSCWVVLYQDKYWQGLNWGFWTDSVAGGYDLGSYITYDWDDQAWETWDTVASSYSIYCY